MKRLFLISAVAMGLMVSATQTDAQSVVVDQHYGQGVHAYHAGQFQEALSSFSAAVKMGTRDPRVYYFRGLTHSAAGNAKAAMADFDIGAQLEISPSGRHYSVGRALERVQGKTRIRIEQARQNARRIVLQRHAARTNVGNAAVDAQPVIPDLAEQGGVPVQTNFPDVKGIQNPGTPFVANSAGDSSKAKPANRATEIDPFADTTTATAKPPASETDPFAGSKKSDDKKD